MPRTIILREDDVELAALVRELLEDAGYLVIPVTSTEEILGEATRNSPCAALIDGMSPAGFDLWWMGSELDQLGVAAIAFTAHTSAKREFENAPRGFAGVIAKPFEADELVALVDGFCHKAGPTTT